MSILSRTDQAAGLRQMFRTARTQFVPVVANAQLKSGGVLLERLCTAFGERSARVLVVDAGEGASAPGEMALVELGQCIERLSPQVSYLAARGLSLRFVDTTGSTRAFLERVAEAAPGADVVLVHAGASELCRLFWHPRADEAGSAPSEPLCPIVFAADRPASVTEAYASMKLIAQRAGVQVFDLLLAAGELSPRADRIAAKLGGCADNYFAAVLRDWARVDPAGDACDPPTAALRRIVAARFENHAAIRPTSRRSGVHADGRVAP